MGNLVDYRKVKKVEMGGQKYDSQAEARMHMQLQLREMAGEISDIRRQVSLHLVPGTGRKEWIQYKPDFLYFDERDKQDWALEVKGYETDVYKLKLRLYRLFGPMPLKVYNKSMVLMDLIYPKRVTDPAGFSIEVKRWLCSVAL